MDAWRPVHGWSEEEVWTIIERHRVNPHPAYRAGFGRVSCQFCIFGNADQWASAARISPERFETVAAYEEKFGVTIKRSETVRELAAKGIAYADVERELGACRSEAFDEPVILGHGEWTLPAGAFGESCGPA